MPLSGEPPLVTGISPAEGPPGTIVKIRGENLGIDQADLLGVFIANVNCTYTSEWHQHYISCRTGLGLGNGDIIIFTKSGGMGTSLVKFRGYMPRVGLLTEAAVWVDESKLFEEKPSAAVSSSRTYNQSSVLHNDPLGVAPEETGAVLPADKIEEWYPGCNSNPLSDKFHPARFLLERHLDTSFEALKMGYLHLQSQDTRKSVGPSSFVRGNLDTILDSLETLGNVQNQMLADESNSVGGNICEELQGVLQSCNFAANSLFKDILTRKDDADSKRNVLNVLQRYRFLFNLPRSIQRNMQQGEYEILISDYNRAKSLFQSTEVTSFKQALSEVEQKVAAFMVQLKTKLFDFPAPVEEQKKLIRYLNDLDYTGNAAWECISKEVAWIHSLLVDCHKSYKDSSERLLSSPPHPEVVIELPVPVGITLKKFPNRSPTVPETLKRVASLHINPSASPPRSITFVGDLSSIICENLPNLWNLGQTYLTNQLGIKAASAQTEGASNREKFQVMVKDLLSAYCDMVASALQPRASHLDSSGKDKMLIPWLPECIRGIKSTMESLSKLGVSAEVMAPMKSLSTTSCSDCIRKVLQAGVDKISVLNMQERWELSYAEKDYCISKLPSMFETILNDSLKFVAEFMTDSKIDSKSESRLFHNDVAVLLKDMLEAFLITLEKSAFPEDLADEERDLVLREPATPGYAMIEKDQRLLVVLSNCGHLQNITFPKIIDQCTSSGYVEIDNLREEVVVAIHKLDEQIFQAYIDIKADPLIGSLEVGMLKGDFRWDGQKPPEAVRQYVRGALLKFVVIHNQVSSISTLFVDRIMKRLCELLTEEVKRIFECISAFSSSGLVQAHLELCALQHALSNYLTSTAQSNLSDALNRLPALSDSQKNVSDGLLNEFRTGMRYQLAALFPGGDAIPGDKTPVTQRKRDEAPARPKRVSNARPQVERPAVGSLDIPRSTARDITSDAVRRSRPVSASSPVLDPRRLSGSSDSGKKKRRAPRPPQVADGSAGAKSASLTNPFLDAAEAKPESLTNPFLDAADEKSGSLNNPFSDSTNPFLDDNE